MLPSQLEESRGVELPLTKYHTRLVGCTACLKRRFDLLARRTKRFLAGGGCEWWEV